jgi:hypothetical protein
MASYFTGSGETLSRVSVVLFTATPSKWMESEQVIIPFVSIPHNNRIDGDAVKRARHARRYANL